jgi:transcriptional regulator with PAS, ATPase and Fis domain
LIHHSWPGNVRELEKALRRAIVLAHGDSVLRPEHLPVDISGGIAQGANTETVLPLRETLAGIECREISRALQLSRGNKSQASRILKISYPNLLKKIRHYGLG